MAAAPTFPETTTAETPDHRAVVNTAERISSRLRWVSGMRHGIRGALAGAVLAIVCVVSAQFDLLPDWLPLELTIPFVIILGYCIGLWRGLNIYVSKIEAAKITDSRLNLEERLSSSLDLIPNRLGSCSKNGSILLQLLDEDAAAHAKSLSPSKVVPMKFGWEFWALCAAIVTIFVLLALPNLPIFQSESQLADHQIVRNEGQRLIDIGKQLERQSAINKNPAMEKAAKQIQSLGHHLANGHMDKTTAMAEVDRVSKQISAQSTKDISKLSDHSSKPDQNDLSQPAAHSITHVSNKTSSGSPNMSENRPHSPESAKTNNNATQSALNSAQREIAAASRPGDITTASASRTSSQTSSSRSASGAHPGSGSGAVQTAGANSVKQGIGHGGLRRGTPHPLAPRSSRSPSNAKFKFDSGKTGGQESQHDDEHTRIPGNGLRTARSQVPYVNSPGSGLRSPESASDRSDVPPTYRSAVKKYFDSLRSLSPLQTNHN